MQVARSRLFSLIRLSIWVIDPAFDDLQHGNEDTKTGSTEPYISMFEGHPLFDLGKLEVLPLKDLFRNSCFLASDLLCTCPPFQILPLSNIEDLLQGSFWRINHPFYTSSSYLNISTDTYILSVARRGNSDLQNVRT